MVGQPEERYSWERPNHKYDHQKSVLTVISCGGSREKNTAIVRSFNEDGRKEAKAHHGSVVIGKERKRKNEIGMD